MKLTHLQSSTQIIDLNCVKILTDPWLTNGEYYGSWYHYPPFDEKEISALEYDYIYVSHIHPDHISEKTFSYLDKSKPVIIHKFESKFLKFKIQNLGFNVIEISHNDPYQFSSNCSLTIFAADNCNPELCAKHLGCSLVENKFQATQIDTFALFISEEKKILNTNDCPFELASNTIKSNNIDKIDIDLLLVGYSGAGPYPQCFHFENETELQEAIKKKKYQFLKQAVNYNELLKPSFFAPFAGTYILGSKLYELNEKRGMPSIEEAINFIENESKHNSKGIRLSQYDEFDLVHSKISKNYKKQNLSLNEYLNSISKNKLDYEEDLIEKLDKNLIQKAFDRFKLKAMEIGYYTKTNILIKTEIVEFFLNLDVGIEFDLELIDNKRNLIEIELNHKLFQRLIKGPKFAHWNNAEIGSHLRFFRKPNIYERGLYHSLCFFHQ